MYGYIHNALYMLVHDCRVKISSKALKMATGISDFIKRNLFVTRLPWIKSVLLYGLETWTFSSRLE